MNNESFRPLIWELMERLRSVVYSKNLPVSALRLLFLKYCIDNYVGANSTEEMQQCGRAQKMFAMRDASNGIESIIPVLQYIDKAYNLNDILASQENIDEYARELFGIDALRQKRNIEEENFRSLLEYLGGIDLEESHGHEIGRNLVDSLLATIESTSNRNSFSAENVTAFPISTLAKELLQVKGSDTFLDFASGTGSSTLIITGDALPRIINIDLNRSNTAVSAMLYIMYGYKNIQVLCGDGIGRREFGVQASKIFVEPPFGVRLHEKSDNGYSDTTLASIDRIVHGYLGVEGEAIVVVPGSVLFQSKIQVAGLRNELVTLGMVRAVITIPPLSSVTNVNLHLLMLTKMPTSDVVFVDATRDSKSARQRNKAGGKLSEELIAKIVSSIEGKKNVDGFSCVVKTAEIQENDNNLVPASYLTVPDEEDNTTLEEINAQLDELYRKLIGQ